MPSVTFSDLEFGTAGLDQQGASTLKGPPGHFFFPLQLLIAAVFFMEDIDFLYLGKHFFTSYISKFKIQGQP